MSMFQAVKKGSGVTFRAFIALSDLDTCISIVSKPLNSASSAAAELSFTSVYQFTSSFQIVDLFVLDLL